MRPQTKKMLDLLIKHGSINDRQARGVTNPRREAAIIHSRVDGYKVRIKEESATKRNYTLKEEI